VIAYVDASVVLRIQLGEPRPLAIWSELDRAISSRLVHAECLRALDRIRLRDGLDDPSYAARRAALLEILAGIDMVPLDDAIIERAGDPFPTSLGTLDALHLSSALAIREELDGLIFATHDVSLGLAASAVGFDVEGLD
jgi:hypothetical protein